MRPVLLTACCTSPLSPGLLFFLAPLAWVTLEAKPLFLQSALWTALALVLVAAARCPPPRSRHANVVEQLLSQPEELVQASWSQVAAPFTANLNALKHDADLQSGDRLDTDTYRTQTVCYAGCWSGGAQHSEAVPVVTASSAARKIANFVAHTENSSSSELGASALSLTRRACRHANTSVQ